MIKAPYVRPRILKSDSSIVYDLRPTDELLKAFPELMRQSTPDKKYANSIGYEWKRKLDVWLKNGQVDNKYGPNSVNSIIDYYKGSMAFRVNLTASSRRSYLHHLDYLRKVRVQRQEFGAMDVDDVNYDYA